MRIILAALGFAAAPAAAADQFDLICTTEVRYRPDADWRASDTLRYRVDLASQRWCGGVCDQGEPLAAVNESFIFFRRHMRESPLDRYVRDRVNRETGNLSVITIMAGPLGAFQEFRGQCETAEFCGFPDWVPTIRLEATEGRAGQH